MQVNTILQGDVLQIIQKVPSGSVDVCFADPPFNLNKKYNDCKDNKNDTEYLNWCSLWLEQLCRITKPTGSIFVHNIPKWLIFYANFLNDHAFFRHWISWDAGGSPMGKTLLPNHYGILWYTKSDSYKEFKFYDIRSPHQKCRKCNELIKDYGGKKHLAHSVGPLLSDVWTDIHRIRHKSKRNDHPCQLPIPLLERIILMSSDVNDLIFDPFMGTGTTAVAAKQLSRNYLGVELSSLYITIAEENIHNAVQKNLFGKPVSLYMGQTRTVRDKDIEVRQHE